MSKGLEALHRIANAKNHFKYDTLELVDKDFQIVQQELQRLEEIENAKPSEALRYIREFMYEMTYWMENPKKCMKNYGMQIFGKYKYTFESIIETVLLKAQEQEKALEIIFEKNIDIYFLKSAVTFDEYNKLIKFKAPFALELTKEEFNLVKRYCNEQDN